MSKARDKRNKIALILVLFGGVVLIVIGAFVISSRPQRNANRGSDDTSGGGVRIPDIINPSDTPTPSVTTNPTQVPTQTPTLQPTLPPAQTATLTCGDCTLAPVNKANSLPSYYAPAVVATGLPGGGSVNQVTKDALVQMFQNASSQGINMYILSSYRSYAQQQSTFEYWVGQEMAAGYSREQAEARANTYSAKPGHSEHQLATTVDLKCSTCTSFDNSAGNLAVYNYLKQKAHLYGFVISYPEGKQNLTGYVHEPWHIRYIGVSLATELFNKNYLSSSNGEYLAKFLTEKALY